MKKRRAFEVFTLSFLDCICCGFGAVVLFYTIVQAQNGAQEILALDQLTGEVSKLEEEVKEGTLHLVQLRNTLEKTDEDATAAQARAIRVAAELKTRREQSSTYDEESLARRAHINQLKADIKSLEEGVKRLQGGALDKAPAGDRVKSFRGRGKRKYISALQMKGKRILVLLDTSASMMDEDIAKVIKLRNQPEPLRAIRAEVAARARHRRVGHGAAARQQPVPGDRLQHQGEAGAGEHGTQVAQQQRSARHQRRAHRGARHHARRWHQPRECVPVGAHAESGARPDHPDHRWPAHAGLGAGRRASSSTAAIAKSCSTMR